MDGKHVHAAYAACEALHHVCSDMTRARQVANGVQGSEEDRMWFTIFATPQSVMVAPVDYHICMGEGQPLLRAALASQRPDCR